MDRYDDQGRLVTVWKDSAGNASNQSDLVWCASGGTVIASASNRNTYQCDVFPMDDSVKSIANLTTSEALEKFSKWWFPSGGTGGLSIFSSKFHEGDIADSFKRVGEAKRFDDLPVTCPAPEPDAEPEAEISLVPTDTLVPDSFKVEEYLCVRMQFDCFGDFEDDTELWSTPAGAQGRMRQILFKRDDVRSCEVVTVWKRVEA